MVYSCPMSNKSLSKRQLGLISVGGGILGFVAVLGVDVIDVGRQGGIGPAQRIALGLMIALILVGLSLIPLKDAPA